MNFQRYGGDQEEHEEAVLNTKPEGFSIATTKEDAKKQMQVLEKLVRFKLTFKQPEEESKTTDKLAGLTLGAEEVHKPATLADFMGEDMEFISKKETADMERAGELSKKQAEEAIKKQERQDKAAKEFRDWTEYVIQLKYFLELGKRSQQRNVRRICNLKESEMDRKRERRVQKILGRRS